MNTKIIIGISIMFLLIGCTEFETSASLCKKCSSECGTLDVDSFFYKCLAEDHNDNHSYCSTTWNSREDLKEFQTCYYDKCVWLCED